MFSKSNFQLIIYFYTVLLVMVWNRPAVSFTDIKFLPGFSDSLPFKLETGYIEVGEVEFFYYFVESERNPADDPLMLWLVGGPGCSALCGLFTQNIGPLHFNMIEYNGSLPTFSLNPYSWTKVASIIFIDAPVGTGFSYSRTFQGFKTGDKKFANDGYHFMKKWLQSHPNFISNPFYIGGDSYAGKIVPMTAQAISDGSSYAASGSEDMGVPPINLNGYLAGNPLADEKIDANSKIPFLHRMGLISDELYESAKRNCREEYIEVDINNLMCAKDLEAIAKCTSQVNGQHILERRCPSDFGASGSFYYKHEDYQQVQADEFPQCRCTSQVNEPQMLEPHCPSEFVELGSSDNIKRKSFLQTQEDDQQAEFPQFGCRNYNLYLLKVWATDISVQKALHVREGTIREWVRCNQSLDYDMDVKSVVGCHLYLNSKGYRALIYSGDHDSALSFVGTKSWIKSLNLSIVDDWRPWFVDGQVAGYSREYENNFTFATIKGAGHTAPEYNPKECLAMLDKWISLDRL